MLTGMLNSYFSCVRGNGPVPNIAAVPAAMLDDISHQAEFLSKQASKQASCQYLEFRSDFLFFPQSLGTFFSALVVGTAIKISNQALPRLLCTPWWCLFFSKTNSRKFQFNFLQFTAIYI